MYLSSVACSLTNLYDNIVNTQNVADVLLIEDDTEGDEQSTSRQENNRCHTYGTQDR